MNKTIEYYNSNSKKYADDTISADMTAVYSLFESYLPENASVLDLGCGSGRDSKHFTDKGFSVTAVDGSKELCEYASGIIGGKVHHMMFDEISFENEFDGVWACASLLHVEKNQLPFVFSKIEKALKNNGVCYASFKYGDFSGMREGRYYTDLTESGLTDMIAGTGFSVEQTLVTNDVRPGRNDIWLNVILRRLYQ